MSQHSKRTSVPAPREILSPVPQAVPSPATHPVPPAAIPSMSGPGAWCPPHSVAPSSMPFRFPGLQHPGMTGSSAQGPWWAPAGIGSANLENSDLHVWGVDSCPPGGLVNFLNKNTPNHGPAQAVSNGSSSQPINNVGDDTNGSDCPRTEKRMVLALRSFREKLFGSTN